MQWQPPTASPASSRRAKHAQHGSDSKECDDQQDGAADAGAEERHEPAQHDSSNAVEAQHAQHSAAAEQPLCLLSTSMDDTMMLWRPDPATGWNLASLYLLGRQILAVVAAR